MLPGITQYFSVCIYDNEPLFFSKSTLVEPDSTPLSYPISFTSRTQECSLPSENLVHEHFDGIRCVDIYEIVENRRLGKGSYGSVYLCRHRKTGDEFACKVCVVVIIATRNYWNMS